MRLELLRGGLQQTGRTNPGGGQPHAGRREACLRPLARPPGHLVAEFSASNKVDDMLAISPRHAAAVPQPSTAGAKALAAVLRRRVDGEVRFDRGSRALYATDGSDYRRVPVGVVVPRHADHVLTTLAACRQAGLRCSGAAPGRALRGSAATWPSCSPSPRYMNRILEVDPERPLARVQPGVINDQLRAAAEAHRPTFGPDPATHDWCTIGGMVGNNSCGARA